MNSIISNPKFIQTHLIISNIIATGGVGADVAGSRVRRRGNHRHIEEQINALEG